MHKAHIHEPVPWGEKEEEREEATLTIYGPTGHTANPDVILQAHPQPNGSVQPCRLEAPCTCQSSPSGHPENIEHREERREERQSLT